MNNKRMQLMVLPVYQRLKIPSCSWNNFFDCPICGKYRFRVKLNAYQTPFWDEIDISAKCLNCGFTYTKNEAINGFLDADEGFDPLDYIVDLFNLEG